MSFHQRITSRLQEAADLHRQILDDPYCHHQINLVIDAFRETLAHDGKILFCGNGGSAADAQHLAAELSGRFYHDRSPIFAEALHGNTSYLTAVGNDLGFSHIYARAVEAKGRKGDVLVALSTSGKSENVVEAVKKAQEVGMKVVALTGEESGSMEQYSDWIIKIPSRNTPRIQEGHILVGHIICECVEEALFDDNNKSN